MSAVAVIEMNGQSVAVSRKMRRNLIAAPVMWWLENECLLEVETTRLST